MKGFFSGWSSIDLAAIVALLVVIAWFAWCCLPRANRNREFNFSCLILAFLAFSLCAGNAWIKLNAVEDKLLWMQSSMLPIETRDAVLLAQDRLTGGFIMLSAMSIIHGVLWFLQCRKAPHVKSLCS